MTPPGTPSAPTPDLSQLRVAFTGLECSSAPEAACAMARCLRKSAPDWTRIALSSTGCESGLFQGAEDGGADPLWNGITRLPSPEDRESFLEAIDRWVDLHGSPPADVLLPGRDADFEHLGTLGPELAARGIHCLTPAPGTLDRYGPETLLSTCEASHIPVFWKMTCATHLEVWDVAKQNRFPCHWRTARKHGIAKGAEEFVALTERILNDEEGPVLVAPLDESDPPLEYVASALLVPGAPILGPSALRVLSADDGGVVWLGTSVDDPDLLGQMGHIASRAGLTGPVTLRLRGVQGGPLELDCLRPGLEPWIEVQTAVEHNLVMALVLASLGLPATPPTSSRGVLFAMNAEDRLFDVQAFPTPTATGLVPAPRSIQTSTP